MGNYLEVNRRQQVISLLELGWTYRRIESETGVRRETVSRYDRQRRSNAAKVTTGSPANAAEVTAGSALPARSLAAAHKEAIIKKLESGLTTQCIWQDLVEEYGYSHSYESVTSDLNRLLSDPCRSIFLK